MRDDQSMSTVQSDESRFMHRALRLATRGRGCVEPNPMVGCVIVRGGKIIGEGYHRRFGGPHAEIEALRRCGSDPRGATVYVTLEPCCHFGKTPPCTDALRAAGIGRVVAAMRDPNPCVAGRGLDILKAAGIAAKFDDLGTSVRELNAPYVKLVHQRRPWVILKWAQSLDGKIATRTGDSKWITDETQRAHAHRTRGVVDAVIVGRGTVAADDPLLTCRAGRPRRIATRIVLDSQLRTPPVAKLVQTARDVPTWFFCARSAPAGRVRRLQALGCMVQTVPIARRSRLRLSLPAVLDTLGAQSMTNVLVEGGGAVLGAFFDEGLADEVHVYIAPRLIGGAAAAGPLNAGGRASVGHAPPLANPNEMRRLGSGWLLQARLPERPRSG
jgi:diaminohydroxyphosphoribosylaminopyrimidine deaminase/5-amino-6-(5-phosphoribosylamino)uracil reductase